MLAPIEVQNSNCCDRKITNGRTGVSPKVSFFLEPEP